jgi:hypothetical protein
MDKEQLKERSIKVQVLDINKNILDTCESLRAAEKKFGVTATSIKNTYLDKNRLCKGKYYFVSVSA